MSKPKIILIGGGGHCRSCIDVIESEGRFEIAGIVERDNKEHPPVLGYPVLGSDEDLASFRAEADFALITVGQLHSATLRRKLFDTLCRGGFQLPAVISSHAVVSSHATIGAGTIVMHQAVVNAGAKVGKNCMINTKSLIEHDCIVGNHCHLSTGAILNGGVEMGDGAFVGSNATVVQNVHIPAESFVRAAKLVKSEGKGGA